MLVQAALVVAATTLTFGQRCGLVVAAEPQQHMASSSSRSLRPRIPPWQDDDVDDASRGNNRQNIYKNIPPYCFGPNGKLYSVQSALEEMDDDDDKSSSNTVVVLACNNGNSIVVVTTVPPSPYLSSSSSSSLQTVAAEDDGNDQTKNKKDDDATTMDNNSLSLWLDVHEISRSATTTTTTTTTARSMPPLTRLTQSLFAITAGNAVDGMLLRSQIMTLAEDLRERMADDNNEHDTVLNAWYISRKLADLRQIPTQQPYNQNQAIVGDRVLATTAIIWDNRIKDTIYRIDPTGQYWKCRIVVAGRGRRKVEMALMEELQQQQQQPLSLKKNPSSQQQMIRDRLEQLSVEDALILARDSILSVYDDAKNNKRPSSSSSSSSKQNGNNKNNNSGRVRLRAMVVQPSSSSSTFSSSSSNNNNNQIRYYSSTKLFSLGRRENT